MAIDLMDASPDGALPPARADPLPEHSLLVVIGSRGCREQTQVSIYQKKFNCREVFPSFFIFQVVCTSKDHLYHVA